MRFCPQDRKREKKVMTVADVAVEDVAADSEIAKAEETPALAGTAETEPEGVTGTEMEAAVGVVEIETERVDPAGAVEEIEEATEKGGHAGVLTEGATVEGTEVEGTEAEIKNSAAPLVGATAAATETLALAAEDAENMVMITRIAGAEGHRGLAVARPVLLLAKSFPLLAGAELRTADLRV
jgi:hypothetical protein